MLILLCFELWVFHSLFLEKWKCSFCNLCFSFLLGSLIYPSYWPKQHFDNLETFWEIWQFLTNLTIFDKPADFWQICRFLTNLPIFDKSDDFWQIWQFLSNLTSFVKFDKNCFFSNVKIYFFVKINACETHFSFDIYSEWPCIHEKSSNYRPFTVQLSSSYC